MPPFAANLRRRLRVESGFTMIELLVVLVIIGVLASIAVVSYIGFRDRSSRVTAQANVRTLIPALETYHTYEDTYVGVSLTVLRNQYDLQIDDSAASRYKLSNLTDDSFCAQAHVGDWYAWTTGPSKPIDTGPANHC